MKGFLKDYWIWIAIPIVLVTLGLLALFVFAGGDEPSGIVYPVF